MIDVATATNDELARALNDEHFNRQRADISAELKRRAAELSEEKRISEPFNPRIDISADAKYLWKQIFIWFWIIPAVAALILWLVRMS